MGLGNIVGIGTYLGSKETSVEEVAERFEFRNEKKRAIVLGRCGTTNLYCFDENESLEKATVLAARKAIKNAGILVSEISGIFASTASYTTEYYMPGYARILGRGLGLSGIDMLQVGLGCVGSLNALEAACNRLSRDTLEGRTSYYLVASGDQSSRVGIPEDKSTALLFSEGAAAFVITNENYADCYKINDINSIALDGDIFCMKLPRYEQGSQEFDGRFRMNGGGVLEFVVDKALPMIPQLLGFEKFPRDVYFLPHQGSFAILDKVQEDSGIPDENFYKDGIKTIGNLSSASYMFGLEDILKRGLVRPDQKVLIGVFGAELKVGAALLTPRGDPRLLVSN